VLRFAFLVGCLAAMVGLSGCGGGSEFDTIPVKGKVVLADGGSLKGYAMKNLRLSPNSTDAEARSASSSINEDGTFEMGTMRSNDGAIPGKYLVYATIMKNYPPTPADTKKTWVCDPGEIEVKEDMGEITIKITASK
jgi:hypothetical protein